MPNPYYTMPPSQPPKKRGGRPRVHASKEAAAQAKKDGTHRWYQRSRQPNGPADFIAYEPPLHGDVPADTPPETGLRTNIRIPQDSNTQQNNARPRPPPDPQPSAEQPATEEDAEINEQIRCIQTKEQETNTEQAEREAEIVEILLGMRAAEQAEDIGGGELDVLETTNEAGAANTLHISGLQAATRAEEERMSEEESQHSCFLNFGDIDEPIRGDNNSIGALYAPSRSVDLQRSIEGGAPSQAPTRHISPSLQSSNKSSSKKGTSRRNTPFPPQRNNLSSWVKSLPGRPPSNLSSPTPTLASIHNASPSPFRPVENFVPSTPAQSVRDVPPAPATPIRASVPATSASPAPAERTAFKLAKQLRNFQGCTQEQHREVDQLHQEHHRRPDVHSKCSSLHEITAVLRGNHGGTPLPDVLSSGKLMKPMDFGELDCQAAFEGTSTSAAPEDIGTRDEKLPRNLCLSQHYAASRKNRPARVSFDIDSTCCFPTSLAIARQGINWFPKVHPFLNLDADIHFGLKVPSYNKRGILTQKYAPLHKIPHYCFGSIIGMEGLLMFVFFPALHVESDYEHSTYLSKQDQELWYDAVLAPAIHKTIQSSNILQYYPATARIADIDSTTLSAESLARKDSSREQLLKHALQPQYLDSLWSQILETIAEDLGCYRFQGASLFMHAKNTKLESMEVDGGLNAAYEGWVKSWSQATDPQFYNKDRTFVDLAKQTTSEDSALPYDQIPEDHEAEVFLWKKCCLDAYAKRRTILNPDGSVAKGNPKCRTYPWATMRDTIGQTLFAAPQGKESQDGLIYSQFYAVIKTPFDTTKVYVFDNESLENLALDPGYIRSLQQEGGGITFSKGVCEFGYLHSKNRAHANLVDNQWKSYGIREEHRISLTMMEEISQQWRQWDLYDDEIDTGRLPLPHYIVPTKELLGFLYAQINKYCFLFEHVLAHTAMTYSLPETIIMVTALRALRFCYSSNLIQSESLLYKDRWESLRNEKPVVKEGLGMRGMIERCGLGWFLPKINWATWRFAPPHGENILVGNVLMHEEYKRRWRAVKDLRDVYVRFSQAESWYDRYNVQHSAPLLSKWLEYLHALNLEQFDTDIWKAMLKSHKRSPELTPDAIKQKGDFPFCHSHMKRMFSVNGVIGPPHFVTGNKMRFERVADLLDFLFLWEDGKERRGWGNKPYRAILQKSFELVERRLGYRRASKWLDEFFYLVRMTHWVLPYPSDSTFIMSTKTNRNQGLKGRMMWFSAVYAEPEKVELPFRSHPITLYGILWNARRQTFGDGRDQCVWSTSQLISACRDQGVKIYGQDETEEYWVVGKRSAGLKGFLPVWERTQPPRLKILEQIKKKSLDELEELMGGFSRDAAGDDIQDDASDASGDNIAAGATGDGDDHSQSRSAGTGRSIMAAFGRRPVNDEGRESVFSESVSTSITISSGSVFVPSV
jgi:hypothetical protein